LRFFFSILPGRFPFLTQLRKVCAPRRSSLLDLFSLPRPFISFFSTDLRCPCFPSLPIRTKASLRVKLQPPRFPFFPFFSQLVNGSNSLRRGIFLFFPLFLFLEVATPLPPDGGPTPWASKSSVNSFFYREYNCVTRPLSVFFFLHTKACGAGPLQP